MLKTNGTELIDESADVCLHLPGHVTAPAFGRVKVKSSMARSLQVENLLPQNVGSIINYLQ